MEVYYIPDVCVNVNAKGGSHIVNLNLVTRVDRAPLRGIYGSIKIRDWS